MKLRTCSIAHFMSSVLLAGSLFAANKQDKPVVSVNVPERFAEAPSQQASTNLDSLAEWWNSFQDPELNSLIKRAMASNLDVKLARVRLVEARATLGNTRASMQLPTVNANGAYSRAKTSSANPQVPKISGTTSLIPSTYNSYEAYFDASYELDIFGGVRNQVKAARADAAASDEDLRKTLVSTLAEVARDYIHLRQYQTELQVARDNEASQQDTQRITQVRNKAGLVSDLDVVNASASLASTQSSIPTLESNISHQIHAISVLLGQNPGELTTELSSSASLPSDASGLPVGLPSELLRRRPDVREAERNVQAAAARVGVQVSKLFPSITISAQYGGQSGSAGSLFDAAARYYGIGPTIQWGLLNYPALKTNIRVYKAKRDEPVVTYQKTVLTAFQEVEDGLVAYNHERERQAVLETAVGQYRRAANIAMAKYTRGLSNFLDVLEAQRSLYNAEDSLVQSRGAVQTNLISLYKALGGGWQLSDPAIVAKP
jgi:NodT family efflux transporter outer membrane factor (OMF) lipoprotein